MILWLVLGLSILINAGLFWFATKTTRDLLFISEEVGSLEERIEEFKNHVKIIYELPLFYGDDTLKNLLKHSQELGDYISNFKGITDLTREDEDFDEEYEDGEYADYTEYNEEEKDNAGSQEKTTRTGKVIFQQNS